MQMCCSVLQCVVVCCSAAAEALYVLYSRCFAMCCSLLQCVAVCYELCCKLDADGVCLCLSVCLSMCVPVCM